jgi:hypothetical protein
MLGIPAVVLLAVLGRMGTARGQGSANPTVGALGFVCPTAFRGGHEEVNMARIAVRYCAY